MPATLRCYDDDLLDEPIPHSIFLAGPTAAGVARTPWRAHAIAWLDAHGFSGTIVVPEFRDGGFEDQVEGRFGLPESIVPCMHATSCNIFRWETCGITTVTVAMFWMPFRIAAEGTPDSLPGFTTRAEVARELARDPAHVVLGMPVDALSGGHIRYHAHLAGIAVEDTLDATLEVALARL